MTDLREKIGERWKDRVLGVSLSILTFALCLSLIIYAIALTQNPDFVSYAFLWFIPVILGMGVLGTFLVKSVGRGSPPYIRKGLVLGIILFTVQFVVFVWPEIGQITWGMRELDYTAWSFLESHPYLTGTIISYLIGIASLSSASILAYVRKMRGAMVCIALALLPFFYGIFYQPYDSLYEPTLTHVAWSFHLNGFPVVVILLVAIFLWYQVQECKEV